MTVTPIILIALLAQASPPGDGAENKIKAQGLLREGSELYKTGDYAHALGRFNSAYAAYPSPKLLFNIGQANRDLGRSVEALDAFEKFLTSVPDALPSTRAEAQSATDELKKNLGQLRIECETPGAEISVDGKGVGATPLPGLIWTIPGRHQVTAIHSGAAPAIESVDSAAGETRMVTMRLTVLAAPTSPVAPAPVVEVQTTPVQAPATSRGWWLGRKWAWIAAGSAVLVAGGATTFGLLTRSRYDELSKSCGNASVAHPGCSESDISSLSTRQTTANLLWGAAGVAAVAAGVLFYVESRSVTVAPMAGKTVGMLARVEF